MRVIFMGTPEFAVPVLGAVVDAGHQVVAAYSQPPRRGNRGKVTPSPVQLYAESRGIEVRTPLSFRKEPEAVEAFAALEADVAVVAAYGLILPVPVLEAPRLGCLNVHGSLLPRWRGAAPIQRAILAGDEETGVGIMQMEAGLDTGPVLLEERTAIGYKTSGDLIAELSAMGGRLMVEVLSDIDRYPPVPQPEEGVTYAAKIDKAEAQIDWTAGARAVVRQVQGFNPAPGAWFEFGGERIKVLKANIQSATTSPPFDFAASFEPGLVLDDQLAIGCGIGAVRPDLVQRAGRGVMTPQELLRGFPIPPGTLL